MAEVFGLVASGVGVASLAIQLAENARNLKDLWTSIRDAPDDITALIDELNTLSGLLTGLQAQRARRGLQSPPDPVWNACHNYCQSAADRMRQSARNLQLSIQKGKFKGSVKCFLKKNVISKHRESLENTKSMLSLAMQTYVIALQHEQMKLVSSLQSISTAVPSRAQSLQSSTNAVQEISIRPDKEVIQGHEYSNTMQKLKRSREKQYDQRQKSNTTVFTLSNRWIGQIFELETSLAYKGWTYTFRVQNLRLFSEDMIQCAASGNVDDMILLLQDYQVSPFDCDDDGMTLLHFAARNANLPICRLLIKEGADVNSCSLYGGTPFDQFWYHSYQRRLSLWGNKARNVFSEMAPMLAINNGADSVVSAKMFGGCMMFYRQAFPPSILGLLRQHVSPEIQNETSVDPFFFAFGSREKNPEYFWARLGKRSISDDDLDIASKYSYNHVYLLGRIAANMAHLHARGLQAEVREHKENWRPIVAKLVEYDSHSRSKAWVRGRTSPLRIYLEEYFGCAEHGFGPVGHLEAKCTSLMLSWLNFLLQCGANLENYMLHEDQHIRQRGRIPFTLMVSQGGWRHAIPVEAIFKKLGDKTSDWRIWLLWPLEGWAGEFWHRFEHPELYMAGSWPFAGDGESFAGLDCGCWSYGELFFWKTFLGSRRKRKRFLRFMGEDPKTDFDACWWQFLVASGWDGCRCETSPFFNYCFLHSREPHKDHDDLTRYKGDWVGLDTWRPFESVSEKRP